MKRILIAFDDSVGSQAALLDMVRGGFPERCDANVLSIADVWLPPEGSAAAGFPDRARAHGAARKHALELVAAARETSVRGAERLRSLFPGWNVEHSSYADSPAWGILAEARRWAADLIVIGSHGRSQLERFFLGSVSYKVAAEARCSVRIFKSHHRPADHSIRIFIAVDGSSDSEAAIAEALARKWPADARFHLITVLDQKLRTTLLTEAGLFPPEFVGFGESSVSEMLEERAERFRKRRFQASTELLEGDPKSLLLHHAASGGADCIFLGARGLQHGDRLYLGTLASAIATRAHCTVEIVRPGPNGNPARAV